MLRAVIFDFDGVIADDERLHLQGFRQALAAHGISISESDYFDRYLGLDDHDGFVAMLKDNDRTVDEADLHRLMREKAQLFRTLARERVRIFPGVGELLASLRDGDQPLVTAIGSGALRGEIRLILEIAGFRDLFDLVVASEDVSHGKPDPETFRTACEQLARLRAGLTADQCLVIEDSIAGLEGARRAGMKTVGVTNSYPAAELDADLIVGSLEELSRDRCAALFPHG